MRRALCALSVAVCGTISFSASAYAAFPGENGKIAFSHSADTISTINPDGTGRAVLTTGRSPSWSADGSRLAVADSSDPGHALDQIAAINADGSGRTTVFQGCGVPCKAFVGEPTWSPDGSELALSDTVCGSSECGTSLAKVSVSGGGLRGLGAAGSSPAWSPTGSRIAYHRYSDFGEPACSPELFCNSDIYTINADGTGEVRLTDDPAEDISPAWSPDGSKIAFASSRTGTGQIFIMNADGTGQTQRTTIASGGMQPAWSPDGSQIAYVGLVNPSFDIFVMEAAGQSQGHLNVTNTYLESEFAPDWQPLGPEPQRSDYNNAAQYCRALREFLGDEAFRARYGGGANAHGKCVSGDRK